MTDRIAKLVDRNRAGRAGRFRYEDGEWMRARYAEGAGMNQLAREAECSLRTVARWMEHHGIETRARGTKPPRPRKGRAKGACACGASITAGCVWCTKCKGAAYRGTGNPNFRGLSDVMTLVRQHIGTTWRPAVLERDGYRCQRCGDDRGGNLNAHHRVALSVLVRRKRDEWAPDLSTPAARLAFVGRLTADAEVMDLDNGETLCESCHRDHHRGGGTYVYAGATGQRRTA